MNILHFNGLPFFITAYVAHEFHFHCIQSSFSFAGCILQFHSSGLVSEFHLQRLDYFFRQHFSYVYRIQSLNNLLETIEFVEVHDRSTYGMKIIVSKYVVINSQLISKNQLQINSNCFEETL